ncbi:phosphatase PAP2 family protein [Paenibacillus thalictri]|uniref:Phosphatase PAP2 family protein n=1 Tax=Paenibacillus thalictri TaxID=2527873 RepID=A0A4Q9DDP9_9BACL|nr:phosphatase PAP2 family protein [Paenibacillus thalictri]TBL69310.1 phosphatase PAP2 family protein [Paenibacillus thalictri]
MSRVVHWLAAHEQRMFFWVNRRIQHAVLDMLFSVVTHLGGATMTIIWALSVSLFASGNLQTAGIQSCIALALSHLPVALIKKKYPRMRPYLVFPEANICKNPLTDHSFPSGHTTAIFSIVIPFACMYAWLAPELLVLAAAVGMSRIYLGLHYPSDCLVGSMIGSAAGFGAVAFFH